MRAAAHAGERGYSPAPVAGGLSPRIVPAIERAGSLSVDLLQVDTRRAPLFKRAGFRQRERLFVVARVDPCGIIFVDRVRVPGLALFQVVPNIVQDRRDLIRVFLCYFVGAFPHVEKLMPGRALCKYKHFLSSLSFTAAGFRGLFSGPAGGRVFNVLCVDRYDKVDRAIDHG